MSHDASILNSTKQALGLAPTYDVFDPELIMHINSVFMKLQQLGVGPAQGFMIEDEEATWSDFLGESLNLNAVRTYVVLSVRMIFDPPGTSFLMASYEKQIAEYEFRLMIQTEEFTGEPIVLPDGPLVIDFDGGGAESA